MSYQKIETAFQQYIATESCWNIPTALRMELLSSVSALSTSLLNEDEKSAALYTLLRKTLDQQPTCELETKQLVSLNFFVRQHASLSEQSKKAILQDLCYLGIPEAVVA